MARKSRKHKYLSAMVALSLMMGGSVSEARDHQVISYDGHDVFDIIYFDKTDQGNWVQGIFNAIYNGEGCKTFSYDISSDMKSWIKDAGLQWAEILKPGLANIKQPAQLIFGSHNLLAYSTLNQDVPRGHNYFKNVLMAGEEVPYRDLVDKSAYDKLNYNGFCTLGLGMGLGIDNGEGIYGWNESSKSQLNHNPTTADLTATTFHELAHALGVYCNTYDLGSTDDQLIGHNSGSYFNSLADDPMDFNSHLLDQNGNKARAGQIIVVPDDNYTPAQIQIMNDNPEKYFQVSSAAAVSPDSSVGRVFFTGTNVTDVLDGKKFWGIDGVPILSWENGFLDLSHIELERSLMSHQNYRSYSTFMEAELAVMQDIGYKIDRRNFYGHSIYDSYLNGTKAVKNTQGFFARNDAGTDYIKGKTNTATYGVGLHVYGSHNDVTQTLAEGEEAGSADLLAGGTGAAGIRVDGIDNNVTLASDASIEANGQNGAGILVAYGRDHNINVDGNVSAMGEGGDGIRFDFGSSLGQTIEYRGSYTRYRLKTFAETDGGRAIIHNDQDMMLADSENIDLKKGMEDATIYGAAYSFTDHVDGDLGSKMATLTISGSVSGKSHAIYMDKSAFVDNINIEKGAQITGDIVSDWKHYPDDVYGQKKSADSKLRIQYGDRSHYYDEYCSDLVTNLNVNGDFAYSGNITGSDNMKLKVQNGATMAYTGTADVVSVKVDEDSALYGGNFKVNEVTKYAEGEATDFEAGNFVNYGTIGALDKDSSMNIDGDLESKGFINGIAGGSQGGIYVTGEADLLEGSVITADRGIHGESVPILRAEKGIIGMDKASGGTAGLLNYQPVLSADGKSINAVATAKDTLDGATTRQAEDYSTLNNKAMSLDTNPGTDNELRTFYGLDSDDKARQALDEIGTHDREDSVTAVLSAQSSTVHNRVLSSRLATALGQSPAMLHVGVSQLDDGENAGVEVPVKLSTEKDKSAWVKFSRNWSKTASGSNYTGNIITMGYDWKHGENQRNGFFGSYTDSSYGHYDGSEKLQDTRFGYYTGIHKGADTQLLYADFGYLKGDRSRNVGIAALGTNSLVKGDYTGWLAEIGGEWKHALHEIGSKTWQVSPYGAFQMSYMKQNGYKESGSLKAYDISGGNNFYAALEGGFEFSRYMPKGSFNFRLGLRHALTGTGYETNDTNVFARSYSKASRMDKTHLVTSLAVETEFAPCWNLGAELTFQKGAHDRDIMASLKLRRMW